MKSYKLVEALAFILDRKVELARRKVVIPSLLYLFGRLGVANELQFSETKGSSEQYFCLKALLSWKLDRLVLDFY